MSDEIDIGPTLGGGEFFRYIIVSHDFPSAHVPPARGSSASYIQFVPKGASPYAIAGTAGTWLGKNNKKISELVIVGHGAPGQMFVGTTLTVDTIGPIGGWLYSCFADDAVGITLHGCNTAADSTIPYQGMWRGTFDKDAPGQGYAMMKQLARNARQTVKGGIDVQVMDDSYKLEGLYLEVAPNGSYKLRFAGGT